MLGWLRMLCTKDFKKCLTHRNLSRGFGCFLGRSNHLISYPNLTIVQKVFSGLSILNSLPILLSLELFSQTFAWITIYRSELHLNSTLSIRPFLAMLSKVVSAYFLYLLLFFLHSTIYYYFSNLLVNFVYFLPRIANLMRMDTKFQTDRYWYILNEYWNTARPLEISNRNIHVIFAYLREIGEM